MKQETVRFILSVTIARILNLCYNIYCSQSEEVIKKSKIFKISGNFLENGEWVQPDPSFAGEIVVDDDNTFHGYCNELYDTDTPVLNKTRYLTGTIATNSKTGKECIAFFKLSNYIDQMPLLYIIFGEEGGQYTSPPPC